MPVTPPSVQEIFLGLLPYLASLVTTLSLAIFTFRRRSSSGAGPFSVMMFLEAFWTLGYIISLVVPELRDKIFWDRTEFFGSFLVPVASLAFVLEYTGKPLARYRLLLGGLSGLSILFALLANTLPIPGAFIESPRFVLSYPFTVYDYEFGPLAWLAYFYSFLISLISIAILGYDFSRQKGMYRVQTLVILAGLVIPVMGAALLAVEVYLVPNGDVSPFSFALANILIALSLFRYRLFNIIPLARSSLMDHINNPVLVLDGRDQILDFNSETQKLTGLSFKEMKGKPLSQLVFPLSTQKIPDFVTETRQEIEYTKDGEVRVFEANSLPFRDRLDRYAGRLVVLYDITRRRQDEVMLRTSQVMLEERVRQRTGELELANRHMSGEINERKRAEKEKQESESRFQEMADLLPQGIFECDSRLLVSYVNQQALALIDHEYMETDLNVLDIFVEEQRAEVRQNFMATLQGEFPTGHEYLVQRKDGSRLPVLVYSSVIVRDEQPVGLRGVVLDISELKQAQQNLLRMNRELSEAYEETLEGWSRALELRERETAGHSRRVVELTLHIGREMGMRADQLDHVRRGAYLHDIGKIGIPDAILLKPGPLSDEEWTIMRQHPRYARDLLASIPFLKNALDIPYRHHEHWDGSGYPDGLKGEEIPLAARIFSVVDVWDALNSNRPYRPAWDPAAAMEYIRKNAGIQFDEQAVATFLHVLGE